MKNKLVYPILLLALALSACGGDNNTAANDPDPLVVQPDDQPAANGSSDLASCTAVSTAAEDNIGEGEWVSGPQDDYTVTLIEYGDFQ